jgi:hypothetical protein
VLEDTRGRWVGTSELDITCSVLSATNDKVVLHRQQGKTSHVMVGCAIWDGVDPKGLRFWIMGK